MDKLLAKLATYKLLIFPDITNDLHSHQIYKLMLSAILLLSVTCLSVYLLFRLFLKDKGFRRSETNKNLKSLSSLLGNWHAQNKETIEHILDIVISYAQNHLEAPKLPKNIKKVMCMQETTCPLSYEFLSPPSVSSADVMVTPLRVSSRRLSFAGILENAGKYSRFNFALNELNIEISLSLSFRDTELVKISAIPSKPSYSLLIESEEVVEFSKNDMSTFIEEVIRHVDVIWHNAQMLLERKPVVEDMNKYFLKNSNDEAACSIDVTESTGAANSKASETLLTSGAYFNFDSSLVVNVASPLLEEATLTASPIVRHLQRQASNSPPSKSPSFPARPTNISQATDQLATDLVVLAHNPSLKKKLNASHVKRPYLRRSASDADEKMQELGFEVNSNDLSIDHFDSAEPVPLDPVVHPGVSDVDDTLVESAQAVMPSAVSRSANASQRRNRHKGDISPHRERVSTTLTTKNLLVKVVKADFVDLRNTSVAYCVVEVDEPYQRHATHVVPSSEQLFWDQHLLFDLNCNSKRAAFEVFELSKRKKSISRGYAEILLTDLLSNTPGGVPTGAELLRCIPLEVRQQSSSVPGNWDHATSPMSSIASLAIRKPSITAEFHFMERIIEDPFSVCKGRTLVGSPSMSRKQRGWARSPAEPTSASSGRNGVPSEETTAFKPFTQNYEVNTGSGNGSAGAAGSTQASTGSREKDSDPKSDEIKSVLSRSTSVRGSRLFEPAYTNLCESSGVSVLNRSTMSGGNPASTSTSSGGQRAFIPRLSLSASRKSTSAVASSVVSASTGTPGQLGGMGLLGPASQLAGVVAGLTAASADIDTTVDPSTAAAVATAFALAGATGHTSAGVELIRPSTDMLRRRKRRSFDRFAGGTDSLFDSDPGELPTLGRSDSVWGGDQTLINRPAATNEPVVRYAAPAANVAESIGTFSAQTQLRKSDASSGGLMKLFKSKKKLPNSSGVAKLMYLEKLEGSEFDTISTEGYQRIVQGDRMYDPNNTQY